MIRRSARQGTYVQNLAFLLVFFLFLSTGAVWSASDVLQKASGTYNFSAQGVVADFSVQQLPFGTINGRFHTVTGRFLLNGKHLTKSSVSLTIWPKSVKTPNPETDAYLRGPDFFYVSKFPTATFKSTKIEKTGENTALLIGNLKIRNKSVPMTFKVIFDSAKRDANAGNKYVLRFSAKGAFLRSKFGMTAGIPIFSDTVDLDIKIAAVRK